MKHKIIKPTGHHQCRAVLENGVITFTCPWCDYVRVFDLNTGETSVKNWGDVYALHRGWYERPGLQIEKICLN